jgi:hypothetical protein
METKELDWEQIERLAALFACKEKQIISISINKDLKDDITLIVEYKKDKENSLQLFKIKKSESNHSFGPNQIMKP